MTFGPILIFDKSTLQSLSVDESCWLDIFYRANITPLFFVETLADLEKEMRSGRKPEQIVANIAHKTPMIGSLPNVHHSQLCLNDLFGNHIEMQRVPIVGGGIPLETGDRKGILFKQAPEAEAFQRWQQGEFLDIERQFARFWRRALSNLDFEIAYQKFRRFLGDTRPKTLGEVKSLVDNFVRDETRHSEILSLALDLLGVPQDLRTDVFRRWVAAGLPPLQMFAPYAAHVFTVDLFFYVAMAADLISRERPSNKIDLAYFYYLPFCMVFASNDNLHIRTVPFFLNSDQSFIHGRELKADLKLLDDYHSMLPEHIKESGLMSFAAYPPLDDVYLTTQLWDKYLPQWRENAEAEIRGEGLKIDKEMEKHFINQIKRFEEEGKPISPEVPIDPNIADNVHFQRRIAIRRGKWRMISAEIEKSLP